MRVTYCMRADGRIYETEQYGGTAKHVLKNAPRNMNDIIKYETLDSIPQEHGDKMLMLMAGRADGSPFTIAGVGKVVRSRQVYVTGYDEMGETNVSVEDTTWFELWFDDKEGTHDTNRDAGIGSATRPAQYF